MFNSVQESVVRVYDVGRRRDDEDEQVRKPTIFSEEIRKPLPASEWDLNQDIAELMDLLRVFLPDN